MAKSTKEATSGKRPYVKKNTKHWASLKNDIKPKINDSGLQPFQIEIEPPAYRLNVDLANTLKRIELTVPNMLPGQAFIAPAKSKNGIKTFMENTYPNMLFRYSIIKDNPVMMRVYFLKLLNKNHH